MGETVRIRLPGQKTWTPGECIQEGGPRSYHIRVGERVFRRNRRQLLLTREAHRQSEPLEETRAIPQSTFPRADDQPGGGGEGGWRVKGP